ncbi:MAG: hypothetical protein Q4B34_00305 [Candidatus Saccharibacteria bacterium]|nr:hypothetical protein [Candidatus Saccharibacteria bacterium]
MPGEKLNNDTENNENGSREREVGAKVLNTAGFNTRHQEIVDSSFEKARSYGEKLVGKNNERRNDAYIERLDSMVKRHGNKLERRLWGMSLDKIIIQPEDIEDAYWQTQEQILRDNGQGHELADWEKERLTEEIRDNQRQSAESWSNYFADEDCPYPMWFKVYAWDGMSKMGIFDKEKRQFKKRDEHTVAPYPHLDAGALGKTYEAISNFYDLGSEGLAERQTEEQDDRLKSLIQSGNFNKIYSKFLLERKVIIKTPERTEDVHGDWVEYNPGDEENLAKAADGTPWCVASPSVGRSYLEKGKDGNQYNDSNPDSKAKFILFRLQDPATGQLADNACASIRLDVDGNVAEISGLNDGQALEDSLVPIAEEKVRSLPGGEEFLQKFADKKQLIALDQKMQNGEDLTKEELEFLYEVNRPIATLDNFNADPRVGELLEKYDVEYALKNGISLEEMINALNPRTDLIINMGTLLSHGADINSIMERLSPWSIYANYDLLLAHGAKIDFDDLTKRLDTLTVLFDLDFFRSHGANIDINDLAQRSDPLDVVIHFDEFASRGANLDINDLASKLEPCEIFAYLDRFLSRGANANNLVARMEPEHITRELDNLLSHGADVELIRSRGVDV